ncbi:DUF456 domain-containing protein [bacterium]|nr:DUF456 domain-containing protein [bacterium]MBU1651023.1 DUF456 domain-containing protein [bacterium]MBU1881920.1 DUF456 domain-containing protein [bacterium]
MWTVLGTILLFLTLFVGVLMTSLGLFGTWVILGAGFIYAWITGFAVITLNTLITLAGIAVILEVVEFVLAVKLAEKMGAGKSASWAAVVGGFIGGIIGTGFLPIIGSVIGVLIGAYFSAVLWEMLHGKSSAEAMRAGRGAFVGRGGAILAKTMGSIIMVFIIVSEIL